MSVSSLLQSEANISLSNNFGQFIELLRSEKSKTIPREQLRVVYLQASEEEKKELLALTQKDGLLSREQQGILITLASQEALEQAKLEVEDETRLLPSQLQLLQDIAQNKYSRFTVDELEAFYILQPRASRIVLLASINQKNTKQKPVWNTAQQQKLFTLAGQERVIDLLSKRTLLSLLQQQQPNQETTYELTALINAGKKILMAEITDFSTVSLDMIRKAEGLLKESTTGTVSAGIPFSREDLGAIARKLLVIGQQKKEYVPSVFVKMLAKNYEKN